MLFLGKYCSLNRLVYRVSGLGKVPSKKVKGLEVANSEGDKPLIPGYSNSSWKNLKQHIYDFELYFNLDENSREGKTPPKAVQAVVGILPAGTANSVRTIITGENLMNGTNANTIDYIMSGTDIVNTIVPFPFNLIQDGVQFIYDLTPDKTPQVPYRP